MPARLVSKRATIDLRYQFEDEVSILFNILISFVDKIRVI